MKREKMKKHLLTERLRGRQKRRNNRNAEKR